MFLRMVVIVCCIHVAAIGQLIGNQFDISNLTPQQRLMADQYIKQSKTSDGNQSRSTETLSPPVTSIQKKRQSPTQNAKTHDQANLNLSVIEQAYHAVDIDHQVKLNQATTLNQTIPLRQFGYDFFGQRITGTRNSAVPKTYQLQPGDYMTLFIYGKKEQVLELTIDNEGTVFIPNSGPVVVSGLTLDEANEKITKLLKKRYVNFETRIKLNAVKRVMVLLSGHVNQPGAYDVNKFESIFSVLSQASGIKKSGSLRQIKLLSSDGQKQTVDLYDYVLNDTVAPVLNFNEGDILFVPAIGDTVAIEGAVNMRGIYEVVPSDTLADALRFGGGPGVNAYVKNMYLNRFDQTFKRKISSISGQDIISVVRKLKKMRARNGDVLVVNQKPNESYGVVNVLGNVNVPGKFEFKKGMTLGDLIKLSEGLKVDSHKKAHVFRYVSEHKREMVSPLVSDRAFKLKDRDVVTIYNVSELKDPQIIEVIGEVQAPGEYTFFDNMTLQDSLLLAKPNAMASLYVIEVSRTAGKKAELFYVNQLELATFKLKAGDQISVKKDNLKDQMATIALGGEVVFPGQYRVAKGTRLADVIRRAGGYTDSAFLKGAVFTRASVSRDDETGQKKVIDDEQKRFIYDQTHLGNLSMDSQVSMGIMMTARQEALQYLEKKVGGTSGRVIIDLHQSNFQESADNFVVQDGDKLIIPTTPESVHLIGGVQQGISIAYNPRYSVHHYIQNVGGFTKYADKGNIYIFKASGRVFQHNAKIEPGDIVYVPEKVIISFNWLQFLTNITSIVSNAVTSIALVKSLQ